MDDQRLFQLSASHLASKKNPKTLTSSIFNSMTRRRVHTLQYQDKVKLQRILLNFYLKLKTTQDINGLALLTCRTGLQTRY